MAAKCNGGIKMKCLKCNHEWSIEGVEAEQLKECPKCHKPLVTKFESFESLSEALYYCITLRSKEPFDLIKNKARLNATMDDVLGSSYDGRNMIKNAVASNVGGTLYDAVNGTDSDKQRAFVRAVDQMIREYSTTKIKAEETVKYFTDALGWNIKTTSETSSDVNSVSEESRGDSVQNAGISSAIGKTLSANAKIAATNNNSGNAGIVGEQTAAYEDNAVISGGKASVPVNSPVPSNNAGMVQMPNVIASDNGNVVITKKKKSHIGIILLIILLILAALAAYIYFTKIRPSDEVLLNSVVSMNNENSTETVTIVTTDNEEDATTIETTIAETTTVETTATEATTVEATSTEATESATEFAYKVKNIMSGTSNLTIEESYNQKFAVNKEENSMYYISDDRSTLYKVNLDTMDSTEVFSVNKESDEGISEIYKLVSNPYDGNIYCIGKDRVTRSSCIFNVNADSYVIINDNNNELIYYSDGCYFIDTNTLSVNGISGVFSIVKLFDVNTGSQDTFTGKVPIDTSVASGFSPIQNAIPIIYDDNYYWLEDNSKNLEYCDTLLSVRYTQNGSADKNLDLKRKGEEDEVQQKRENKNR